MKIKVIKSCVLTFLIFGLLIPTVTACACENGYWTMKTDESGISVMIYTYTKSVDWDVDEQSDLGRCGMQNSQSIKQVEQAKSYMSKDVYSDVQQKSGLVNSSSDSGIILISSVGLLSLAVLGYFLYKAV